MATAAFDPDAYLAAPATAPAAGGFDPDAYLAAPAEKPAAVAAPQQSFLSRAFSQSADVGQAAQGMTGRVSSAEAPRMGVGMEGLAMGAAGPGLAVLEQVAPKTYQGIESGYQAQRKAVGDTGVDLPRMEGEAAYLEMLPVAKAGSFFSRLYQNAKNAAGVTAITAPTGETEGNQILNKAKQVAGAAALGGSAPLLGEMIGKGATKLVGPVMKTAEQVAETATEVSRNIQVAKSYVEKELGMKWDSLSAAVKKQFSEVAANSKNLSQLDPKAAAAVARASSKGVPITRGEATRNLEQLTQEKLYAKTTEFTTRRAEQDQALHNWMRDIKGAAAPTSTIKVSEEAGSPVEKLLARKERVVRAQAKRNYKLAEQAGALSEPLEITTLLQMGKDPIVAQRLGGTLSSLNEYAKSMGGKHITINQAENLRQDLNSILAGTDGPAKAQAYKMKQALDVLLDNAGNSLYRTARKSYRLVEDEFERQGIVRDLTSSKSNLFDQKVSTERVLDRVANPATSIESLVQLKKSLLEGGTEQTRKRGQKAWQEVQAGILLKLQETAAEGAINQNRAAPFQGKFLSAFDKLDVGNKLETIFGKEITSELRKLYQTVQDVRTVPGAGLDNSHTAANMAVGMLAKLGTKLIKIPGAEQVSEIALASSRMKRARTTPLAEAAADARRAKQDMTLGNATRRTTQAGMLLGNTPTGDQQ